jgi:plasmid stabilization system protein ParE
MSNQLELTPQARDDARAAYAWYEGQSPGLGDRFLRHVDECLALVQANPELFEVVYRQYRRAIVRRFPYVVFYKHAGDVVKVHSIFQSAQNPRKWRRRLP